MHGTPVGRWTIPIAVAAGLAAASLPCVAEARGGGGGGFGGGFHGGSLHGGGFHGGGVAMGLGFALGQGLGRGGIAVAPRGGAAGPHGFVPRGGYGIHHGGARRFGQVILVPRGYRASRSGAAGSPFPGGVAVPPLRGGSVPPFAGTVASRPGGVAAPPPAGPGLGVAEIWRRDGGAWRLDLAPLPVTAWRRGADGRWYPENAN